MRLINQKQLPDHFGFSLKLAPLSSCFVHPIVVRMHNEVNVNCNSNKSINSHTAFVMLLLGGFKGQSIWYVKYNYLACIRAAF